MTFYRWGLLMARHRRAVFVVWILLLIGSIAAVPLMTSRLGNPDYSVTGSESAKVDTLLQRDFSALGNEQDVIVFDAGSGDVTSAASRTAIARVVSAARAQAGVTSVTGPFDQGAQGQVSKDHTAALALVALHGSGPDLTRESKAVGTAVRTTSAGGVRAWFTGFSPITNDLTVVETKDSERAESIGIPVALVMLLLALGAVTAALLPILFAIVGLILIFGVIALLTLGFTFDGFLVTIVTMIGTGIGIDYAMFIVSRFREELARRGVRRTPKDAKAPDTSKEVSEAVGVALTTSGRTVAFSGVIVAISLCSLFIVDSPVFQEVSVGVIVTVLGTLLAALTLLPAVLAKLGPNVNRGALPRRFQPAEVRTDLTPGRGGWARWAHAVMRHPAEAVIAVAAVLILAAWPLGDLRYGIDLGTASLQGQPTAAAQQVLTRSFGPGIVSPLQIVLTGPGDSPLSSADARAASTLADAVGRDHRVESVGTLTSGGRVLIDAVPSVPIDSSAATGLVDAVRHDLAPKATAGTDAVVQVGGATAQFVDLSNETRAKLPYVLALVLGLSLLYLVVVFRSLVLPIKAVAMNLLVTAASIGLTVAVFQWGHGGGLLGFTSVGFLQVYLPISVFVLLFGLSMDYEVFLIRRMREVWDVTHDNREAVAAGIEHTARPIAAAAAIMVAVFGSFMSANVLELKEFGLALAAAIALDATLVRLVLVPAFMRLLGNWNWWLPSHRASASVAAADQPVPSQPSRK
jgi:RND superfamily putative drug exporter